MQSPRGTITSIIVPKTDAGQPLQLFLATRLSLSKRAAKNIIDGRNVWVNRQCVWMAHHALKQGDTVEIPAAALKSATTGRDVAATPAAAPTLATPKIRVLVQDDFYVILDKPAGLLSVGEDSAESRAREQLSMPGLLAVHRIDRDTSGCLMLAKTPAAHDAAVAVWKTRKVVKIYQAIVIGRYVNPASTVTNELDGERAVSHIRREMATNEASFLRIQIETGRTHQIRRHLASLRFPIVGDRQYGMKFARNPLLLAVSRQMLHACEIALPHPMMPRATLKAHSPLPADFRRCLKMFGMGK